MGLIRLLASLYAFFYCLHGNGLCPILCSALGDAPGDRKRKACQYRGVGFELLCTPPFAHVIAASYKRGAARHCELEMYVCDLCNQSFSTQGSLKRHRESVHRQSGGFSCRVCGQRFYRKDHLGRHLKMHRAARPTDKTFVDLPPPLPPPSPVAPPESRSERPVCDLCAKTFASQKTLKRHRQTHDVVRTQN